MSQIRPHIFSETGPLKKVVIGIAKNSGPTPEVEACYDPKSRESVLNGTYPKEEALIQEMAGFVAALEKHGVKVYRPDDIPGLNQVFARDICFALEDKFIVPNIIVDRQEEIEGVAFLENMIDADSIIEFKDGVHAEGGDCMPWRNHLFVGFSEDDEFKQFKTARTNRKAVERFKEIFPKRTVYPIELVKDDLDPRKGILHLDCCFQPIGHDEAILFPGGFKHQRDVDYVKSCFGEDKIIEIDREEFYLMFPNVFSIDPNTIVSNSAFTRLNDELVRRGYTVEAIPYTEVSKMGGLLRCSSMPLNRDLL